MSVGREGLLKHEEIASPERGSRPFRLLLSDRSGREWVETADAVIDCTGAYSRPNALGDGGIPAPGEAPLDTEIVRRIPDLNAEAQDWADRRILLVGAGHSALTAADALARLGQTRIAPDHVTQLRVPTLVISGHEDVLFPPEALRSVAAALPGARLIELPEVGHSSYFEVPERFNQIVLEFLAE